MLTTKELINQLAEEWYSGNDTALELLYEESKPFIKRAYWKTYPYNSRIDEEDLISEVWFRILSNKDRFETTKGKFSSWLFSIARYTYIDLVRREQTASNIFISHSLEDAGSVTELLERIPDPEAQIDKQIDNRFIDHDLRSSIDELDSIYRTVLLSRANGRTLEEIAELLSKTHKRENPYHAQDVHGLLQTARRKLKKSLAAKSKEMLEP